MPMDIRLEIRYSPILIQVTKNTVSFAAGIV